MDKVICECGHHNPFGTMLCENCGKPLGGSENEQVLTMRYDGTAIRSKVYKRTVIDKIWGFFSSVKIGVTFIILALLASAVGTIFPQQVYLPPNADPTTFYTEQYGSLGTFYHILGFDNLYKSWWFIILLGLLGTSIIVASIDRGVPLYRTLKKQRPRKHDQFLRRQRLFSETTLNDVDTVFLRLTEKFGKRYHIKQDGDYLSAEKGRFARWGPYVNHVGLILILIGGMLKFVPGMYVNEQVWIKDGQTVKIPGTDGEYYIKNNQFILENYDKDNPRYETALNRVGTPIPKNYQSDVTLYKKATNTVLGGKPKLDKVTDYNIQVNHPLTFAHFGVYQASYKTSIFDKMSFKLEDKKSGKALGPFEVNLNNPKATYKLGNGYRVTLLDYFPDFYFNDKKEPDTKTNQPKNPAFLFKMVTPETPKGETAFIGIKMNLEPLGKNQYKIIFNGLKTTNQTGLVVKKDLTMMIVFIGAIIFLTGVVQGMFWTHRRVWIHKRNNVLWFSATTNKNWYGLKREIAVTFEGVGIREPVDRLEEREMNHGTT